MSVFHTLSIISRHRVTVPKCLIAGLQIRDEHVTFSLPDQSEASAARLPTQTPTPVNNRLDGFQNGRAHGFWNTASGLIRDKEELLFIIRLRFAVSSGFAFVGRASDAP